MAKTFQISSKHFVAGVIVTDGIVTDTAPILRYMTGWTQTKVLNFCRVKNWKLEAI